MNLCAAGARTKGLGLSLILRVKNLTPKSVFRLSLFFIVCSLAIIPIVSTAQKAVAPDVIIKIITLSMDMETSECFITEILTIGEHAFVTVDFIEYRFIGEDEDGMELYELANNDPQLRTYMITPETLFNIGGPAKTLDEIRNVAFTKKEHFNISVEGGKVLMLKVSDTG